MPRATRSFVPGGIYHVMNRGNRRQPIFSTDSDRQLFLGLSREVAIKRSWVVHAYCLMPNHFHAVVETPDADLSEGVQELTGAYAQWFNRLHRFDGHLFQGRFKAVTVESDWHLLELTRYIATNPSRAGLCPAPIYWDWGSYRGLVTDAPSPFPASRRILSFFGRDENAAREALRRFVEDGR
jgi:REP element-mobilizing transposase RayT